MNCTNLRIFSDMAAVKQTQKTVKELTNKFNKNTKKSEIIDKIKNVFQSYLRTSYAGEINVTFIPNLIIAYHEGDEIKYVSVIDNLFEPNFNLFDLYDEKDNAKTKSVVYSFLYSYYFSICNYKKVFEIIKLINKEDPTYTYIDIGGSEYFGYTFSKIYKDEDIPHNEELLAKRYLSVLYAMAGDKTFKKEKRFQTSYIGELNTLARKGQIEGFLSDKFVLLMHQKVMHDYFEGSSKKLNIRYQSGKLSLLDDFETKPESLTEFLNQFPIGDERGYWKITERDSYALSPYLDELDNNKERLVEIFNSYLYSQYALGQKSFKLEDRILQMCSVLSVLGYDEYNVMDIVEGLPEKIQRAALTGFVGD